MSGHIDVEQEGEVLTTRLSLPGRLIAGFYRGAKIFPWLLAIAAVFFFPDYYGRYAEQEPVPGLFWGSIVGLVLLGCFLWGVLRVVRRDRWIFDGKRRDVRAEIQTLWGEPGRGAAGLREIEGLELVANRWPRESELAVWIDSDEVGRRREVMFSGPGMVDELRDVGERVVEFLRDQRYYVELDDNPEPIEE